MKYNIGDRIFVSENAGFQSAGIMGTIIDSLGNRECIADPEWVQCALCNDPDCIEWNDVLLADGTFAYHVSECQMETIH
jgi:hypothetical protein